MLECRIRELRHDINMTQATLSELTGITIGQISCIENNKNYPSAIALWRIANALNCLVDKLYYDTEREVNE